MLACARRTLTQSAERTRQSISSDTATLPNGSENCRSRMSLHASFSGEWSSPAAPIITVHAQLQHADVSARVSFNLNNLIMRICRVLRRALT